jgi:Plasmid pRiA4b ORF-3-like protein
MMKGTAETMKRTTKRRRAAPNPRSEKKRLFTLDVSIVSGPMTRSFARKNPVISRTIAIRADQTLAQLHDAIFDAFDRDDEHLYEFQIGGRRPMDPKARRYVLPMAMDDPFGEEKPARDLTRTTLGSLGLKIGEAFSYWFDFGDDWWHQVDVLAIDEAARSGKLPKVTRRAGESPPQYVDWDETE